MTSVCIFKFISISIGLQRSEASGCANGYPEGHLTHIAMFEVTAKAMLDVDIISLWLGLDAPFAHRDRRQKIQTP